MFHFVEEDLNGPAEELTADQLVERLADPFADPHEAAVVTTDPWSGHRRVLSLPVLEREVMAARLGGGSQQRSRDDVARELGVRVRDIAEAEDRARARCQAVWDIAEAV